VAGEEDDAAAELAAAATRILGNVGEGDMVGPGWCPGSTEWLSNRCALALLGTHTKAWHSDKSDEPSTAP
jgi:hypothetical protein